MEFPELQRTRYEYNYVQVKINALSDHKWNQVARLAVELRSKGKLTIL